MFKRFKKEIFSIKHIESEFNSDLMHMPYGNGLMDLIFIQDDAYSRLKVYEK
jgi:hypothetical protein